MKRRHLWLTIVAVLALVLAACGSGDTEDASEASETAAAGDSDEATNDDSGAVDGDCTPLHDIVTIEEGYLTVAAYAYPPFSGIDGETLTGAEGEIISEIAAMECLEIKVLPGDAAAMIPSITSGRADTTIGSWYRTEEREEVVLLGAPVIATEQYPRGLGSTIAPIGEQLREAGIEPIEKVAFSACNEPRFLQALKASGADSAVVFGMETHICVFQTVRDLIARGMRVDVPIDGVASRREDHRQVGLNLCAKVGANITTSETILFDWLVQAGGASIKKLAKLVR